MKRLLTILGTMILTTTISTNVIACFNGNEEPIPNEDMAMQVKKDFGFFDENNHSLIKVAGELSSNKKNIRWVSNLKNITANNLLEQGGESNKAKSVEAADFLVNVLKLNVISGEGNERIFNHNDAQNIKLLVKSCLPSIDKKTDNSDYVITGGTITIFFQMNNKPLTNNFSLDILSKPDNGIINYLLPTPGELTKNDFNSIPEFTIGQPKTKMPVDKDITIYLNPNSQEGKILKMITNLIKQGDLIIKISQAASGTDNFVKGDSIKVKITIGKVTFITEYTLTI